MWRKTIIGITNKYIGTSFVLDSPSLFLIYF